jgi:starch synthase (maltosyl-transferring)
MSDRQAIDADATVERARLEPELVSLSRRVVIEDIKPEIDRGRFAIKRTPGEQVAVTATIFADGHDVIAAVLRDRHVRGAADEERDPRWRETGMRQSDAGADQWTASFQVHDLGWHEYAIVAWVDRFRTWRRDLEIKAGAGQDVAVELLEGALLVREAAARADNIGSGRADALWLLSRADALADSAPADERVAIGLERALGTIMDRYADRSRATASPTLRVWVDRERARFSAWYEMFPRSAGTDPTRSATFREACARLPAIADLGFDVLYLPPIHPIGQSFRKGRNNSLVARPGDPGSPWAIGSEAGGHTAIEPSLGTLEDFLAFRDEANRLGLELALDLAWQTSPDHPWVREHPEWFRHRPDGTIKHAENPPKKYQDIYPLDFSSDDWPALWRELLNVTLCWVERGVRIFRVDNPHTKTLGFWQWLIAEVRARDARVIFLSEAFTRPAVMRYLAKVGFSQSYSYFSWRNTRQELIDYFTELTSTEMREYFRPNLFANTPDILSDYLQRGGSPAFRARLLLASTLGASYGIYAGFELCEARALPGTEEYANSEKYEFRCWDWSRPGNINELVARVNLIRRRYRALQYDSTLRFLDSDNPHIIAFTKSPPDGPSDSSALLIAINLDPHHMQQGFVRVPPGWEIARRGDRAYGVRDLIDDAEYWWRSDWNYVRFDPDIRQGHILELVTRA